MAGWVGTAGAGPGHGHALAFCSTPGSERHAGDEAGSSWLENKQELDGEKVDEKRQPGNADASKSFFS